MYYLPEELWLEIFHRVESANDKTTVCLVNKKWRAMMAPIMWEVLTITAKLSSSYNVMMNENNGITPNVRTLCLGDPSQGRGTEYKTGAVVIPDMNGLLSVVSLLPKNGLRCVQLIAELDFTSFKIMLNSQRDIERLFIPRVRGIMPLQDRPDNEGAALVLERLQHLTTLSTELSTDIDWQFLLRYIIAFSKSLRNLELSGYNLVHPEMAYFQSPPSPVYSKVNSLLGKYDKTTPLLANIVQMKLAEFDFYYSAILLDHLDLQKLKSLSLVDCLSITNFVRSLSTKRLALKALRIEDRDDACNAGLQHTVEQLLNSFSGLEQLWLRINGKLLDGTCLERHGDTLKLLVLERTQRDEEIIVGIEKIIKTCKKLKMFGMHFPWTNLSVAPQQLLMPDDNLVLEEFLNALCAHSSLHAIRDLNSPPCITTSSCIPVPSRNGPPNENSHRHSFPNAHALHLYASEIIKYLAHRGASIKELWIGPHSNPLSLVRTDPDGRRWPLYHYRRGYILNKEGEEDEVIAVPVPNYFGTVTDLEYLNYML